MASDSDCRLQPTQPSAYTPICCLKTNYTTHFKSSLKWTHFRETTTTTLYFFKCLVEGAGLPWYKLPFSVNTLHLAGMSLLIVASGTKQQIVLS